VTLASVVSPASRAAIPGPAQATGRCGVTTTCMPAVSSPAAAIRPSIRSGLTSTLVASAGTVACDHRATGPSTRRSRGTSAARSTAVARMALSAADVDGAQGRAISPRRTTTRQPIAVCRRSAQSRTAMPSRPACTSVTGRRTIQWASAAAIAVDVGATPSRVMSSASSISGTRAVRSSSSTRIREPAPDRCTSSSRRPGTETVGSSRSATSRRSATSMRVGRSLCSNPTDAKCVLVTSSSPPAWSAAPAAACPAPAHRTARRR
jgi:hypothetical protein